MASRRAFRSRASARTCWTTPPLPITFRRKQPGPFQRNMRLDRVALALAQAYFLGQGFASDLPFGVTAFLKTPPAGAGARHADAVLDGRHRRPPRPICRRSRSRLPTASRAAAMPMRPVSRGHVELASADPADARRASIRTFLDTEDEWRVMRDGIRMVREVVRQPGACAVRRRRDRARSRQAPPTPTSRRTCARPWAPCIIRSAPA